MVHCELQHDIALHILQTFILDIYFPFHFFNYPT